MIKLISPWTILKCSSTSSCFALVDIVKNKTWSKEVKTLIFTGTLQKFLKLTFKFSNYLKSVSHACDVSVHVQTQFQVIQYSRLRTCSYLPFHFSSTVFCWCRVSLSKYKKSFWSLPSLYQFWLWHCCNVHGILQKTCTYVITASNFFHLY